MYHKVHGSAAQIKSTEGSDGVDKSVEEIFMPQHCSAVFGLFLMRGEKLQ